MHFTSSSARCFQTFPPTHGFSVLGPEPARSYFTSPKDFHSGVSPQSSLLHQCWIFAAAEPKSAVLRRAVCFTKAISIRFPHRTPLTRPRLFWFRSSFLHQ